MAGIPLVQDDMATPVIPSGGAKRRSRGISWWAAAICEILRLALTRSLRMTWWGAACAGAALLNMQLENKNQQLLEFVGVANLALGAHAVFRLDEVAHRKRNATLRPINAHERPFAETR